MPIFAAHDVPRTYGPNAPIFVAGEVAIARMREYPDIPRLNTALERMGGRRRVRWPQRTPDPPLQLNNATAQRGSSRWRLRCEKKTVSASSATAASSS